MWNWLFKSTNYYSLLCVSNSLKKGKHVLNRIFDANGPPSNTCFVPHVSTFFITRWSMFLLCVCTSLLWLETHWLSKQTHDVTLGKRVRRVCCELTFRIWVSYGLCNSWLLFKRLTLKVRRTSRWHFMIWCLFNRNLLI